MGQLREKEYVYEEGRRVPVLIGAAMLDRETTRSISFVLDLTARKAAESELARVRQPDARFRELIESAPDAVVVVGEDARS